MGSLNLWLLPSASASAIEASTSSSPFAAQATPPPPPPPASQLPTSANIRDERGGSAGRGARKSPATGVAKTIAFSPMRTGAVQYFDPNRGAGRSDTGTGSAATATPTAGAVNTGSGGGASGDWNTGGSHTGKNGGSGIVIVRYPI